MAPSVPTSRMTLASKDSVVLVIYTGGTIGMLESARGYVTYPNYLHDNLRTQSRFHDPLLSSVQANSVSVDSYRTWVSSPANSGTVTPERVASPAAGSTALPAGPMPGPSTAADARSGPSLDVVAETGQVKKVPTLVLPQTSQGHRVRYAILEFERLIDSSEVDFSDYLKICRTIQDNYTKGFDAFIILHGTDTMSYSASALSFLLENLGKTVILTGAQIPLSSLRNDAVENLLGALMLAGSYLIPEVCLYFNDTLFRGNRTNKRSSFAFDAFETPNLEPLAKVGISIDVRWDLVVRPTSRKQLRVHDKMCEHVAVLRLFPGITPASVRAFLAAPIQGVVLETFGAGNAPQKPALLDAFREAAARGVVIVNVSQCAKGTVASEIYETGRALAAAGITGGRDMTTECALAKLAYLLSKGDLSRQDVRNLIGRSLRGELTVPATLRFAPAPPENRLASLVDRLSLLSQYSSASRPPIVKVGQISPSRSGTLGVSLSSAAGQIDDSEGMTQDDLERADNALAPVMVSMAAGKDDGSLQALLHEIFGDPSLATDPSSSALLPLNILNDQSSALHQTPLHVASILGLGHNVETLLDFGASVHLRDAHDHTPLFYAAKTGNAEAVQALRKAGAHLGIAETASGEIGLSLVQAAGLPPAEADRVRAVWAEAGIDGQAAVDALRALL